MTEQTELSAAKVAKGSIYLTLETVLVTLISVTGFAVMARMITLTEMFKFLSIGEVGPPSS